MKQDAICGLPKAMLSPAMCLHFLSEPGNGPQVIHTVTRIYLQGLVCMHGDQVSPGMYKPQSLLFVFWGNQTESESMMYDATHVREEELVYLLPYNQAHADM